MKWVSACSMETAIFGSSISLDLRAGITWERLGQHVDDLVLRDRNHPGVFGWSPSNEMFALFLHTTPADKEAGYAKLAALAQRPRRLDSTRQWISMDGDKDLQGTLSVWSSHFGIGVPSDLPDIDKPRMIGEHGGTYFAAPPLLQKINGDRAFQDYAGRNEALATDLYQMVVKCALPELTALSPSELVWFGLEQLPFGYRTDARPPGKQDGVFFPLYVEDVPGVQIERLPPYVMTLNPGFDPALPLYKPLAMFHAIKAALDPRGSRASTWDHPSTGSGHVSPQLSLNNRIVQVGFAEDLRGALCRRLFALGVPLVPKEKAAGSPLLVVDGETISEGDAAGARVSADTVVSHGGLVWVMLRDGKAPLSRLRDILPPDLTLIPRRASSLIYDASDPMIDGFSLDHLYFADETTDPYIQKAGLDGPPVLAGRVLLTASATDWSLFERQPESRKCSSVLIYKHVHQSPGAALVEVARGSGKLWVSTLDATIEQPAAKRFWTQMFHNLGVKLVEPSAEIPDSSPASDKAKRDLLPDGPLN